MKTISIPRLFSILVACSSLAFSAAAQNSPPEPPGFRHWWWEQQQQQQGGGGFHTDFDPLDPTSGGSGGGGPPTVNFATPDYSTNLCLLIAQNADQTMVTVTLSNTSSTMNYLLLASTNLLGPWVTNQSLQGATGTNMTVAAPVPIYSYQSVFFIATVAPAPDPLSIKWVIDLGVNSDDTFGNGLDATACLSPEGLLYMPTLNSNLIAINPLFQTILWTNSIFTVPSNSVAFQEIEMVGSAAAVGSQVYVGGPDWNLYSFNSDGSTNWIRAAGNVNAIYSTPSISSNGLIYIGSDEAEMDHDGNPTTGLTAFNPDGTTNFFFMPQDFFWSNGGDIDGNITLAADGTAYFLAEGHRLYAVSPTGQLIWFLTLPSASEPDGTVSIMPDGSLIVPSHSVYLYNINSDGSIRWVLNLQALAPGDRDMQCQPAIGPDGVIYVGTTPDMQNGTPNNPGNLFAINPDSSVKWICTNIGKGVFTSPALAADGTAYVADLSEGNIYAIQNGNIVASTNYTSLSEASSPVIMPDGSIVIGGEDGKLYCLWGMSSAPLDPDAPSPTFQQNLAHTGQSPFGGSSGGCDAPFVYDGTNDGMGDFIFDITGPPGSTNWSIYASTNLATTNWTLMASNLTLDPVTGNTNFTDTGVSGVPQRFYRVGQSNCWSQAIGFYEQTVLPGTNLIANQLCQVDDGVLNNVLNTGTNTPMNSLSDLFLFATIPWGPAQSGTEIYKSNGNGFDGETNSGNEVVIWQGTGDLTLLPGASVIMVNSNNSPFTNLFIGLVRNQQVFQLQPGTNYYLSATVPMAGVITNIIGYRPQNGDHVKLWNSGTSNYTDFSYASSAWSPSNPVVEVGEGFVLIPASTNEWTNTWQVFP